MTEKNAQLEAGLASDLNRELGKFAKNIKNNVAIGWVVVSVEC
jgi:hypothetical protein